MNPGERVGRFEHPKPVSVGDQRDVEITGQGGQGDGIARIEDFVIFVKGARKGERCRVKITEVKRTFAIGEKIGRAADKEAEAEMEEEIEGPVDGPAG